jgi:hypothetical protein
MDLGAACKQLLPISAVLVAEADLCAQIAAGVEGEWDNELQQLTAVSFAGGIAQIYQMLRPLQMECLALEQAAALAEA